MNAETLKPCPFCGGERASPIPANRASEDRHYPIVRCMGCYMDMPGETGDFSIGCRTAIAAKEEAEKGDAA